MHRLSAYSPSHPGVRYCKESCVPSHDQQLWPLCMYAIWYMTVHSTGDTDMDLADMAKPMIHQISVCLLAQYHVQCAACQEVHLLCCTCESEGLHHSMLRMRSQNLKQDKHEPADLVWSHA